MGVTNFKLRFLFILIVFILLLSCDDGWYMRKRWEGRRSSTSIEDSKNRQVFIRELNFETENLQLNKKVTFFLEKGYRWGYHSYKETRLLDDKENLRCQIISNYNTKDNKDSVFGDTLIAYNDYYTLNKFVPVKCNSINNDTLIFYLIVNRDMYQIDTISKIKVWND